MNVKPHILLIYTGGTIGSFRDSETGSLKPLPFPNIRKLLPEIEQLDIELDHLSLQNPVDSSDMNPEVWGELVELIEKNEEKYRGFVILHGTDTMAYTASAVSFMLDGLKKPVIFTGSQLPINIIRTDGRENLVTALEIAALQENGESIVKEVCIYFEYKLYRGNRAVKVSAEHFNAFDSPNFPALAEAGVHIDLKKEYLHEGSDEKFTVYKNICCDIAVLKLFPGMSTNVLKSVLETKGLKGLVLETFGTGNASAKPEFLGTLSKAVERGVVIVNVTQCMSGKVEQSLYETGRGMEEAGAIGAADMTTEAAVTKLMYLLGRYGADTESVKKTFSTNLRGELSN
jgi:L-asparaginase